MSVTVAAHDARCYGPNRRRTAALLCLTLGSLWIGACTPRHRSEERILALMQAEDRRASDPADLDTMRAGTHDVDAAVRRIAVRALGRLQRSELAGEIVPVLEDAAAPVRAMAAWALAQALVDGPLDAAAAALQVQLRTDPDPGVAGAAATSLGRLPWSDTHANAVQRQLVGALGGNPSVPVVLGVARGLESLFRTHTRLTASQPTRAALTRLLQTQDADAADARLARVRALAVRTLQHAGVFSVSLARSALGDPAPEVRRLAASAAAGFESPQRDALLDRAGSDPVAQVRYAAVRSISELGVAGSGDCQRLVAALEDFDAHVVLAAIDGLSQCPGSTDRVIDLTSRLPAAPSEERPAWHIPAHALVAAARLAPQRARPLLGAFVSADRWQLRRYAALAAAAGNWTDVLVTLADDPNANVREAALNALAGRVQHRADAVYVRALSSSDPQLLITAARALAGSPEPGAAVPSLFDALSRLTRRKHQTTRDARRALIERIVQLGSSNDASRIRKWLHDFDPVIAGLAAEAIETLAQEHAEAQPTPLPPTPFPSLQRLHDLDRTRVTVQLATGGQFVLRLLPWDAPTNTARFARLAADGTFDGLTFHRVVPNFVIQGGSPGANEYAGHGAYTRDELTDRSHLRGTVGISTRGHDTGDGQFFVNLVDNVRLDHRYTIFAEVVDGMDAVDQVLEGARIEHMQVRGPR